MNELEDYNLIYQRIADGKEVRVKRITANDLKIYDPEAKTKTEITRFKLQARYKFIKDLKPKSVA